MNSSFTEKYAALSIVIMPFFACYNVYGTSLAKYFMLLTCIILFFSGRQVFSFPRRFVWFLFYAFTVPQIVAIATYNTSHFWGSYLSVGLFAATLCFAFPFLRIDLVTRYYRVLVYFTIVVFALQELSSLVLGHRFSALIPFLTLYNDIPASQYASTLIYADRSSSVFVEPSHYAQYLAPFLALSLFRLKEKHRFFSIEALLLSVVYLIMRSGNGLFLCAAIWITHFLVANIRGIKKLFLILPLSLLIVYYGFTFFSQTEKGAEVLDRQEQLSSDYERTSSSGTIRIYRGFYVQAEMPLVCQVFGVGLGGSEDIIDHSSVKWMFFNEHYLNNASGFLISFGYLGTLLFLVFLFSQLSKKNKECLLLIVAFIVLCLMESFMFDCRMLLYISLICLMAKEGSLDHNHSRESYK